MNLVPSYGSLKLNCSLKNNFDSTIEEYVNLELSKRDKTQLKIHQIQHVRGVSELSRSPLEDGRRDFSN